MTTSRIHRFTVLLTAGALAITAASVFTASSAGADQPVGGTHQGTLCHASDSDTNPYEEITVDVQSGGLQGGHETHTGPIWNPTLKDAHTAWGDIIPAFTDDTWSFAGLNNDAEGLAILANSCNLPQTAMPVAPVVTQSGCPATSTTPTAPTLALPATAGIEYAVSAAGPYSAGASVTVTATVTGTGLWFQTPAPPGWTIVDPTTARYVVTFDAAPTCTVEPVTVTPEMATVSTPTCAEPNETVTLPTTAGVVYTPSGSLTLAPGQSVTITPSAAPNYALAEGSVPTTITNTFDPVGSCQVEPTVVTPQQPTTTTPTCTERDMTVSIPTTTGVVYTASGPLTVTPGKSVTITPSAAVGYILAEGSAPTTLTNTLKIASCSGLLPALSVTRPAETSGVLAETTTQTGTLAQTGAGPIREELLWAFGMVLLGGLVTAATRRRRAS